MTLAYYVVFEHTEETGGYKGVRFYVGYKNADDFEKHRRSEDDSVFRVIDKNITEDQARDIVSCTPEICRLTALVEEAFVEHKDRINFNIFKAQFTNVTYAIMEDRLWKFDHHLKLPKVSSIYQSDGSNTLKDRVLCAVIKAFPDPHGNIGDLSRVENALLSIIRTTK